MLSDLDMWNLIVAFASATFIIPAINRPYWSSTKRAIVAAVFCILAGLGTAYFNGGFAAVHDVHTAVRSVLVTFIGAIGFYRLWAQPSGIASKVEAKTSPPPPRP